VGARAQRSGMLQRWLAAWFAGLLAVAPVARPSVPIELAAAPVVSPEAFVADNHAQGKKPAAGVLPPQSFTPGILSRLSLLETLLGLPPVRPPLLRPAAGQSVLARGAALVLGGEPRRLFQRSSVGTARTPTGPPA
jgi:hypothetical protein